MIRKLALLASVIGAFGALASGQSSHDAYPADQKVAVGDIFATLRADWARNLHDKNIDASVAQYSNDAEFFDPGGNTVRGPTALRQLFTTITATYDSDLTFTSLQVGEFGDLAYDAGSYQEALVLRATGKQQHSSGTYLTVYKRGSDGRWLISEQSWTGVVGDGAEMTAELAAHPVVALTFDDLPAAGSLPPGQNRSKVAAALAAELKANHLEGTYGFVNAVKLENDPDAQQALHSWVDAGMNIGSHTWSHISLSANTAEDFEHEIARNEPALAEYGETRDWHWFRYPFLWEGDTLDKRRAVRAYLRDRGYRVAQVCWILRITRGTTPMAAALARKTHRQLNG